MTTKFKKKSVKEKNNEVLNTLKEFEGFNSFDPRWAVKVLEQYRKSWKQVVWDKDEDDTIYVVPKAGRIAQLECLLAGYQMGADEIEIESTGIIRIWFD